jgi:hypothetical protein
LDWSDEHYVKLYTRNTATRQLWPWQAKALHPNMLMVLDKAGIIDLGTQHTIRNLGLLVGLPIEVVKPGLEALLEDGTVELHAGRLVMPKFIEAQEARKTEAAKARDYRERRKAKARVKVSDFLDPPVTERHPSSPDVTERHPPALPSPALPDPSPAQPERQADPPGQPKAVKKLSWHFELFEELTTVRRHRLEELELDDDPAEVLEGGFIAASLKKVRDFCGGDIDGVLQLYDAYLAATWPAEKSPPYPFRVFASEKTYAKLKQELAA